MTNSGRSMKFVENIKKQMIESQFALRTVTQKALVEFQSRIDGKLQKRSIQYIRTGNKLQALCKRGAGWLKNLKSGAPVNVYLDGEKYTGWAEAIDNPDRLKKVWGIIHDKFRTVIDQVIPTKPAGRNKSRDDFSHLDHLVLVEIQIP